jgi:phosphohistidine phosphatase
MKLLLVQHGQAKSEAEDPARSLTDAGTEAAEKTGAWLAAAGIAVDEIRHSGKTRAEQTAMILNGHLSPQRGVNSADGLKPMDDVHPVAHGLMEYHGTLMLVGHLPFLSRLTGFLVTGEPDHEVVRFQNAGVVCLGEDQGMWGVDWALVPDLLGK